MVSNNSTWLIFGLGNPSAIYNNTRHNIGYKFIDNFYFSIKRNEFNEKAILKTNLFSSIAKITYQDNILYLAKNTTFMNESGISVDKTLHYLKITLNKLIVIHDDIDLKFGKIKISFDSGSAGHRGVASIIEKLASKKFYRARIGIWNLKIKKTKQITQDYVMQPFKKTEEKIILSDIFPHLIKNLNNLIK